LRSRTPSSGTWQHDPESAVPTIQLQALVDIDRHVREPNEEAWSEWDPSTDDTDPQNLILYEVYTDGILVDDGVVGGTNTIAYCRFGGLMEIVLRAVDTSGNRSGPSNAITWGC
jgi:hypothetical protein